MSEILRVTAAVRDDGTLDLTTSANEGNGFAKTRQALQQIRDELDRILREGADKCPFRNR